MMQSAGLFTGSRPQEPLPIPGRKRHRGEFDPDDSAVCGLNKRIKEADCRTVYGLPLKDNTYPVNCPIKRRICAHAGTSPLEVAMNAWRQNPSPDNDLKLSQQLAKERSLMIRYCHYTDFALTPEQGSNQDDPTAARFNSVKEYDEAILRGLDNIKISSKQDTFYFRARVLALLANVDTLKQQLNRQEFRSCWSSENLLYMATHGGKETASLILEQFSSSMSKVHLAIIARHYPSLLDTMLDKKWFSKRDDVPHLLTAVLGNKRAIQQVLTGTVNPFLQYSHRCFLAQDDQAMAEEYLAPVVDMCERKKCLTADMLCAAKWLTLHPDVAGMMLQTLPFLQNAQWEELIIHIYTHHPQVITEKGLRQIARNPQVLSKLLLQAGPSLLPYLKQIGINVPLPEDQPGTGFIEQRDTALYQRHPLFLEDVCQATEYRYLFELMRYSEKANRVFFDRLGHYSDEVMSPDEILPQRMTHPANQEVNQLMHLPLKCEPRYPFHVLEKERNSLETIYEKEKKWFRMHNLDPKNIILPYPFLIKAMHDRGTLQQQPKPFKLAAYKASRNLCRIGLEDQELDQNDRVELIFRFSSIAEEQLMNASGNVDLNQEQIVKLLSQPHQKQTALKFFQVYGSQILTMENLVKIAEKQPDLAILLIDTDGSLMTTEQLIMLAKKHYCVAEQLSQKVSSRFVLLNGREEISSTLSRIYPELFTTSSTISVQQPPDGCHKLETSTISVQQPPDGCHKLETHSYTQSRTQESLQEPFPLRVAAPENLPLSTSELAGDATSSTDVGKFCSSSTLIEPDSSSKWSVKSMERFSQSKYMKAQGSRMRRGGCCAGFVIEQARFERKNPDRHPMHIFAKTMRKSSTNLLQPESSFQERVTFYQKNQHLFKNPDLELISSVDREGRLNIDIKRLFTLLKQHGQLCLKAGGHAIAVTLSENSLNGYRIVVNDSNYGAYCLNVGKVLTDKESDGIRAAILNVIMVHDSSDSNGHIYACTINDRVTTFRVTLPPTFERQESLGNDATK